MPGGVISMLSNKVYPWLASLMLALSGGLAHAAAVVADASGEDENGQRYTMTIEARNAQTARIRFPEKDSFGYMLLRNGKGYMVIENDGDRRAIDMASFAALFNGDGNTSANGVDAVADIIEARPSGRSETVAGVKGKVYKVTWRDGDGKTHNDDMVLSSDSRVRLVTQAWVSLMSAMTGKERQQKWPLTALLERENAGILRFGTNYRVQKLSIHDLPDQHFALPDNTQASPFAAAAAAQAQESQQAKEDSDGGVFGKLFKRKAERTQDKTENRVDQKVDEKTDKLVDKALDKLFDW